MTGGNVDLGSLAQGALRAADWCRHLPPAEEREALRLWLAHRLAGRPRGSLRETLEGLLALLEPAGAGGGGPAPAEPAGSALEPLLAVARQLYGEGWLPSRSPSEDARRAAEALGELCERLRQLVSETRGPGRAPLPEVVEALSARTSRVDAALRRAAQDAFDRLLHAMSPASLEAQGVAGALKVGPFHRAALFEAWAEKHAQLEAYHRAGRLVSDFRAAFRRHLRDNDGEEGSG